MEGVIDCLLDAGCGFGRALLHFKLLANPQFCIGIDFVRTRIEYARQIYARLIQDAQVGADLNGVFFLKGSINDEAKQLYIRQCSHIYCFDARFSPDTKAQFYPFLQRLTSWKLLASYCKPQELREWGLRSIQLVASLPGRTMAVAGEKFTMYVYIRSDATVADM